MENTVIISTPKRAPLTGLPASAFQHPLDRHSPEYNNILAGSYSAAGHMVKTLSCPTCKQVAEQGLKFCNHCATPLITH